MKKTRLILATLLVCLSPYAGAATLELPIGLSFDPPAKLDLTYQTIPAYDETEKVIAGWTGDKLQYFVGLDSLPPEYTDAKKYFSGLEKDLRATWGAVESGKITSYKTASGLNGSVVVLTRPATPQAKQIAMAIHHLTDGKQSFYAIGTPVPPTPVARVLEDTLTLMKSARLSQVSARVERSDDALVGTWISEERLPDGKLMLSVTELKPDLTFTTNASVDNKTVLSATGVWSRSGEKLQWDYIYSKPELPNDKRKDEDRILSIQADSLELQSVMTGKKRVLQKAGRR